MFYIYLIKSLSNEKTYVGFTKKLPKERLEEHNHGSNFWTRKNGPFKLIYWEEFVCKEDALKREAFLKTGQGKKLKNAIVQAFG